MAAHSPAYLARAVSSRGWMSRLRTRRSRSASSAPALRWLCISPTTRSYSGPKRCWSLRRRAMDAAPMTRSTTTTATMMAAIAPADMGALLLTGFRYRTDCPGQAAPNPQAGTSSPGQAAAGQGRTGQEGTPGDDQAGPQPADERGRDRHQRAQEGHPEHQAVRKYFGA